MYIIMFNIKKKIYDKYEIELTKITNSTKIDDDEWSTKCIKLIKERDDIIKSIDRTSKILNN